MIAKFSGGRCAACNMKHIHQGDEIVSHFGGWATKACMEKADRLSKIESRIIEDMREKHKVALGVWGIPDDYQGTFTRGEFYKLALDKGACTQDEYKEIYSSLKDIWIRDLSD